MDGQTIIVILCVVAAVAYFGWRMYNSIRKGDCGCGCGSDCESKKKKGNSTSCCSLKK